MTTAVQRRATTPAEQLKQFLRLPAQADQFKRALPKAVEIDRWMRVLETTISANPKLAECSRPSLMQGAMTIASLGLMTDSVLGEAYLIPFKDKQGIQHAQVVIGYKGLLTLARRSGQISSIEVDLIHENDQVVYRKGDVSELKIEPNWLDPGEIIGVYAIARFKDGSAQRVVMCRREVDAIRDSGNSRNNPVWKSHYGEMMKKTGLRRLAKYLPLTAEHAPEIAEAVGDALEAEERTDGVWSVAPADAAEPKSPERSRLAQATDAYDRDTGEVIDLPSTVQHTDPSAEIEGAPPPAPIDDDDIPI